MKQICPGKNGGYKLSGLGGRLIVAVRQANNFLQYTKLLKLTSNAHLGCLNGFIIPVTSY